MKNLLVTGSSGFLGSIIYNSKLSDTFRMSGLARSNAEFRFDIKDAFSFPSDSNFQCIFHAAGKAHIVPRTPEEEKLFYQVNLDGTKNLCAAIDGLALKPQAFIFISTVAVYGVDSGELIREDRLLQGSTPYAKSKLLAEEWLKEWAIQHNIVLSILRLPLVAGPNPPGNLGTMINGIRRGRYLSIGKADARKSMVWAEDIAAIIPKLIETGGTYNLTDGYHPSFGELEKSIAVTLGKGNPKSIPMIFAKALGKIGDIIGDRFPVNTDKIQKITSSLTFDDQKARTQLGWNPTTVLERINQMV